MDSLRHMRDDAPGPEGIPLEYCYGDGVCLDFRHLPKGAGITVDDVKAALTKINYTLKPLDIVLIHTGAGKIQETQAYLTDHVGMTGEATHWLLDQGIKMRASTPSRSIRRSGRCSSASSSGKRTASCSSASIITWRT